MAAPSAKAGFSNNHLGKVMVDLIKKGHRVEFDPKQNLLSIYGDLKTDIEMLDCGVFVYDGDVFSNVAISGSLHVRNIDNSVKKDRKIVLDGTSIEAESIYVYGGMSDIYGHGEIIAYRYVAAKAIGGSGSGLTITAVSIDADEELSGVIRGFAESSITSQLIAGQQVELVTQSCQIGEITKGALIISAETHIKQITDGAKVFSYGELRCQSFGGNDVNNAAVMVVVNAGFREKQFRMSGLYAHNAIMFSPDKNIFDDVNIMSIGENPHNTILTDSFDDLPEEMIDFIRLGYSTMAKHTNAPMPGLVSREIHRRFTPV